MLLKYLHVLLRFDHRFAGGWASLKTACRLCPISVGKDLFQLHLIFSLNRPVITLLWNNCSFVTPGLSKLIFGYSRQLRLDDYWIRMSDSIGHWSVLHVWQCPCLPSDPATASAVDCPCLDAWYSTHLGLVNFVAYCNGLTSCYELRAMVSLIKSHDNCDFQRKILYRR